MSESVSSLFVRVRIRLRAAVSANWRSTEARAECACAKMSASEASACQEKSAARPIPSLALATSSKRQAPLVASTQYNVRTDDESVCVRFNNTHSERSNKPARVERSAHSCRRRRRRYVPIFARYFYHGHTNCGPNFSHENLIVFNKSKNCPKTAHKLASHLYYTPKYTTCNLLNTNNCLRRKQG